MAERTLPAVVARMWGREPASRHGPRPSVDLPTILDAAIGLADREGLDGVRMSTVADRVGLATMSLYRYVGSKDELLTLMVDAATPEPPALDGRPWRSYLAAWTRTNRDLLLARPWLMQVTRHTPPTGPRTLRWLDRALAALGDTGLDYGQRINIATTLAGYGASQAKLALSMSSAAAPETMAGLADYSDVLGHLLDPDGYPALTAAVAANAFGAAPEWLDDTDFTFGLDLLLDGVQMLVDRRRTEQRA